MGKLGHEYCVHDGFNRSHAGKYVYSLATLISWILIYFLLKLLGGLSPYWNIIISSAVTAVLFLTFYFLFDKWVWKTSLFFKILKYPDISGQWLCKGISDYQEENAEMIRHNREWEAQITILQSWDKVRIRLETEFSTSDSISAAIIYDEIEEYKVLYSYENKPKDLDHNELRIHRNKTQQLDHLNEVDWPI
ncbi:MAG: hypothetical protein LWW88_08730 [Acinetobacter sp.]|uniref:Cap15 family cyclic dinucleotide receptor domain-containing protein n=1 Tax=Acinetobacter sp. TaxID=472 RepID=UPI00258D2B0D|nr:hypothetical protein [Acinetobacter sp.]MCE1271634.1 hypothetical protein [Acinetobacter sp.]